MAEGRSRWISEQLRAVGERVSSERGWPFQDVGRNKSQRDAVPAQCANGRATRIANSPCRNCASLVPAYASPPSPPIAASVMHSVTQQVILLPPE